LNAEGKASYRREVDELTDDALTQDYRVHQRAAGHRYSFDDVVTAWTASRAVDDPRRIVDLGTGIGSVLLMLAWRFPRASLAGVEAQAESVELLRRNVHRNALDDRVVTVHGDLRDGAILERLGRADLVTGTPPYMPLGNGPVSPDPQRAHARVELRGGVEDYVASAALVLGPEGTFVVCADARTPERVERAASLADLSIASRRDVVARQGTKGPLFSVWTLRRSGPFVHEPPLVLRDRDGRRTDAARELRAYFGLAMSPNEEPSP
jgi:tRNA1Val (adenine37-N6)-methyltransferase